MKKTIFTMLFAALTLVATAQSTDNTFEEKDRVYLPDSLIDQMPKFEGGMEALVNFIQKNLEYPDLAKQYGVEGRFVMTFVIDREGMPKDIAAKDCQIEQFNTTKFGQETESKQKELKEQFALLFAKEGARVIRMMPKWIPGKVKGKSVNVFYRLPISFRIPNK